MTDFQIYEQPLNERIRAFLRLEKLFKQFAYHIKHCSEWNNPVAIDAITELLKLTSRGDIKLEALKELERQHVKLERLSKRPQIDQNQLNSLLKQQKKLIAALQSSNGQLTQQLQKAELLSAVRQKSSVPGCICDFDLPAYQYWLTRPEKIRRQHLEQWHEPFKALDQTISLILNVLRNSTDATDETAASGFFQKSLDTNQAIQLLRISAPVDSNCYPEISAGKHRFSVRFMSNQDPSKRPEQCKADIDFKLAMCLI